MNLANFVVFQASTSSVDVEPEAAPPAEKRPRVEDPAQQSKSTSCEAVRAVKEKVRSVASQKHPNDSLLLVFLEELSAAATINNDDNTTVFQELARQAKFNQGSVDLSAFVLSVLGGGACDVVARALSKCIENEKTAAKGVPSGHVSDFGQRPVSPLTGLYEGAPPPFYQWNTPYQFGFGPGPRPWMGFRSGRGARFNYSSGNSGALTHSVHSVPPTNVWIIRVIG